jgi:DNA modification methylase
MSVYYSDESVTLYHGDADGTLGREAVLEVIRNVDAIVTDPPYNVSSRNGRDGTTVGTLKRKDGTARKVQRNFGDWDHAWDPSNFLEHADRVLVDGGSLVAFTTEFLIGAYMASGLNHRNLIYWRKTNPTPAFKRLYVRAVEMAVWQVKGTGWIWNAGGYRPNVFEGPTVAGFACANGELREHPTQKPLWLMRALLELHTAPGSTVLDPFAGSGTSLVAAKFLGRKAIGIEADEAFCEAAARRLAQGVLLGDAS